MGGGQVNEVVEGHTPVGQRADHRPGETPEDTVFMSRTKSSTRRAHELPVSLVHTWKTHTYRYAVEPRRDVGYATIVENFTLDLTEFFGHNMPVALEIGSGTSEQIVIVTDTYPRRNFLALEA